MGKRGVKISNHMVICDIQGSLKRQLNILEQTTVILV